MQKEEMEYGPVLITRGLHKGRIGYYDDDDYKNGRDVGIVYFGSVFLCKCYYLIPIKYLKSANTGDLLSRSEEIFRLIGIGSKMNLSQQKQFDLLMEKNYIDNQISDYYYFARSGAGFDSPASKVFISHSSKDKWFVRRLGTDLLKFGIEPWIDEWKIKAGELIPKKIGDGIEKAHCIIVVLSQNSILSKWVEREWQLKYWDEVNKDEILVIPLILENCDIPQLLRGKKYVDFRNDYSEALEDLIFSIPRLPE